MRFCHHTDQITCDNCRGYTWPPEVTSPPPTPNWPPRPQRIPFVPLAAPDPALAEIRDLLKEILRRLPAPSED